MRDERVQRLADVIVTYSLDLQAGETVWLDLRGTDTLELGSALVRAAVQRGAVPLATFHNDERFLRPFLMGCTEAQVRRLGDLQVDLVRQVQAYVGVRGGDNPYEMADVPRAAREWHQQHVWKRVHVGHRLPDTRWVVLRWPNASMAQAACTSREAMEDLFFRVCTLDYGQLAAGMRRLAERLRAARDVRIVAPGTDLRLSLAGLPAIVCDGHLNLPDGEVYTAPLRESVEGTIRFNAPSLYLGLPFDEVTLRFERGRVVEASAASPRQTADLNRILDTDEGARFVGEFALGVNREVREPMRDTLFDEKIAGSLHLALGNAYDDAFNGNRSAVHWDLVLIQRPEHGGGELWLDGELLRKDGRFVPAGLAAAFDA